MEYKADESLPGKYYAYYDTSGKKYLVLEGLNPADIHTPGVLEQWTKVHYSQLEATYWVLFFVTFVYLIYTYILLPLYIQYGQLWKLHKKN